MIGAARKVVSESRERTFDNDVADPAQLRESLQTMADELCASLLAHGRSGRTIGIKVRLDDFTTATRAHTIETPTNDVERVTSVALRLFAEYAPPRPVRLLGVRVAGLGGGRAAGDRTAMRRAAERRAAGAAQREAGPAVAAGIRSSDAAIVRVGRSSSATSAPARVRRC